MLTTSSASFTCQRTDDNRCASEPDPLLAGAARALRLAGRGAGRTEAGARVDRAAGGGDPDAPRRREAPGRSQQEGREPDGRRGDEEEEGEEGMTTAPSAFQDSPEDL